MQFQADATGEPDETIKSILYRLSDIENENAALNDRLTQSAAINDRLTQENVALNDRLTQESVAINDRLTQANERLTHEVEYLTQKIDTLQQENHGLYDEFQSMKNAQCPGPAASSDERFVTSSHLEPDTRSQFTAFACTNDIVRLSCPGNRTILTVSADYGQYSSEVTECTECCSHNPLHDCTELVEENRPNDWLAIQALCDNQNSCEFENLGTAIDECEDGYLSDYMQLFYDCLPDDQTGPVAFTAYANTGNTTLYSYGDIMVFNEVLANAGGHYSTATSSFICPWHGLYLLSVNTQGDYSEYLPIQLVRNNVYIGLIVIDDISGARNRGSTTIVTECDRGDILWVRAAANGVIYTHKTPATLFTAHMIHRY